LFERFTQKARQVVVLAQEEARTLRHGHIGTEHILLGLLREREGIAARVLESFDITLERARGEVVRIVGVGQETVSGQLPFDPAAKMVLERAPQAALDLGHTYIGIEHLLLALLTIGDAVSTRILLDCNARADQVWDAVIQSLQGTARRPEPESEPANQPPAGSNGFQEWIRVGPGAGLRRLLMVAAARALDEGREDIQPRDVLLALTRDEHTGPALADLGVDDVAIARALERRHHPDASGASQGS
jgi:ATP-dependent Clp protease ATP-binding subunit ClpC